MPFDNDRAQIAIDYLVGITIFLLAVFFVFQYTSGLFTPFESDSDEITLVADRAATAIVENEMSAQSITTPNLVDKNNVDTFIALLNVDYNDTVHTLGLSGGFYSYNLNVTIENSTSTMYVAGEKLPFYGNIGQTKRIVLLEDTSAGTIEAAIVSVRVW
ncbi:hypothetical protein J2755_001982 [Methanohalophilus levihalophilus]|uniref:DUF7287 family protein n=1 Tax=Methanohalophilus levihalophilus TaxID=1431282 RepID=UPI001AE1BBD3|nr:hypothetical protein [Methanohalophilus levihalophilus]MBP2031034.1 hypothetical protein [Methanohalophilus levihalophilus]